MFGGSAGHNTGDNHDDADNGNGPFAASSGALEVYEELKVDHLPAELRKSVHDLTAMFQLSAGRGREEGVESLADPMDWARGAPVPLSLPSSSSAALASSSLSSASVAQGDTKLRGALVPAAKGE